MGEAVKRVPSLIHFEEWGRVQLRNAVFDVVKSGDDPELAYSVLYALSNNSARFDSSRSLAERLGVDPDKVWGIMKLFLDEGIITQGRGEYYSVVNNVKKALEVNSLFFESPEKFLVFSDMLIGKPFTHREIYTRFLSNPYSYGNIERIIRIIKSLQEDLLFRYKIEIELKEETRRRLEESATQSIQDEKDKETRILRQETDIPMGFSNLPSLVQYQELPINFTLDGTFASPEEGFFRESLQCRESRLLGVHGILKHSVQLDKKQKNPTVLYIYPDDAYAFPESDSGLSVELILTKNAVAALAYPFQYQQKLEHATTRVKTELEEKLSNSSYS